MLGVSYGLVGLGGRGSQGTCLHKPNYLEINRSKAILSGRRRKNRYKTHLRKGKSFLRDRNKRDEKVRQRIAGKQATERQHGPEEDRQDNLI